ncbi:hypothetical protein VMT65_14625 [Nocardia sp. CDC153]|uniref:hypothetical protein n=1 Tax=Nocardia sp. CDC153 TaxID=3112167 RepID=UPI002DB6D961|nr:hypothetical protein [Nocardia sp. CDC153]MEC3954271.1 hypothetical protein [Nocardia sp. CDC153]
MATPHRKSDPSDGTLVGAPELPVPDPLALPDPDPLALPDPPPAISAGAAATVADPLASIASVDSIEHSIRERLMSE